MLKIKEVRQEKGYTLDDLSKRSGVSKRMISAYEAGTNDITLTKLKNIATALKVSLWELVDDGEKIAANFAANVAPKSKFKVAEEPQQDYTKVLPIIVDKEDHERICFVPVSARAGYKNGLDNPVFIKGLPSFNLPGHQNGTFRAFEVDGYSMFPTFTDGDWVIGSYVEGINSIISDRVHIIITKSDVLLKRVRVNHLEKKLIIISDSEEFEDDLINFKDVKEIWYATRKITAELPPPTPLHYRVGHLERELQDIKKLLKRNSKGS